jgi:hypothetical protein
MAYLFLSACSSLVIIRSACSPAIGFWDWVQVFVVGRFANLLFAQSGNLYRATVLKAEYGLSYARYVSANALLVWLDSLLSMMLSLALTFGAQPRTRIIGVDVTLLLGGLAGLILMAPVAAMKVLDSFEPSTEILDKAGSLLRDMFAFVVQRGTDVCLIGKVMALNIVQFGVWVLLYRIAFEGMGIQTNLAQLALFLAIYKLSTLLVFTPGNIGVREVAYAWLGQAIGIGMAEGVLVSAVLRAAGYAAVVPLGLVLGGAHLLGCRSRDNGAVIGRKRESS